MSDVQATTQDSGAAALSTEDAFQRFYDGGGLDDTPREGEQTGAEAAQAAPEGAANAGQADAQEGAQNAPEGAQEESPAYASLDDLLTSLKVDPKSVLALNVTTTIDGKTEQVPLEKVLKSYQLEGHVNNKSIELSNQRSAFEQERNAVRTMFQQQIQQNQALGNLAMQMLNHDYQKVDWNGLRANNPAEFAALQAEFGQRQQGIQNYLGQIQQQAAHEEQQRQQTVQQNLAAENSRLLELRPEWRDEKVFAQNRQDMTKYARSIGFQDAELSQIFDHRYMLILHDAARYQALQAAAPQVLKQVRQAPLTAAPGSRTDVNPREAQRKQVVDRFNRNPRDQDAQAAAFEFFANQ